MVVVDRFVLRSEDLDGDRGLHWVRPHFRQGSFVVGYYRCQPRPKRVVSVRVRSPKSRPVGGSRFRDVRLPL